MNVGRQTKQEQDKKNIQLYFGIMDPGFFFLKDSLILQDTATPQKPHGFHVSIPA